jgi:hypothetical protein
MRTVITHILLAVLVSASSQAQNSNIFSMVSPKLKQFLTTHPKASSTMSNVLSEAFSNRTVQLNYFYSNDESAAKAYHYFPDESSVCIVIRENQLPCDECICLIFEMLNSGGEKRFLELANMAKSGTMQKGDFVNEIRRQEFQAAKRMRTLLANFELSKKEKVKSCYYNNIIQSPNIFEEFLTYTKNLSPQYYEQQTKHYEQEYDSLRKSP